MTILDEHDKQFQSEVVNDVILDTSSGWKRFLNYVLDLLCIYVFGYLLGGILGLIINDVPVIINFLSWVSDMGKIGEYLFGMILMIIYYPFFEFVFGFTPAKIITKTKVVTEKGLKPTLINVIGRNLCRFIPFDNFSFLGRSAIGWHDTISKTRVVNDTNNRKILIPSLIMGIVFIFGGVFFLQSEGLIDKYEDTSTSKTILVSYRGISFYCTENWKIEKEELQQDKAYQINCEKKSINSSEIISITWLNMEMEPREMIENTIEGMKEVSTHKNSNTKPIFKSVYKGFNAFKSDFDLVLFGEKFFGRIISFNASGKTILILKQTDRIDKLDSEFKIVENSLKIE